LSPSLRRGEALKLNKILKISRGEGERGAEKGLKGTSERKKGMKNEWGQVLLRPVGKVEL